MAWNNVYLTTPTPVGNYQGSAGTAVFSGISLSAPLQGEIAGSSAISVVSTASVVGGASVAGFSVVSVVVVAAPSS